MTSDLLEENADLRKQVEELKDEIATRNGKLAIHISENERLKRIVLGNEVEISDLKKSCDETQELLDKQIEAAYKLDKENAELKADNDARKFAMAMSEKVEKQLREEIAELEAQIEKMKCCQNCRKFHNLSYDCTCAEVCNEWEIKEND